MEKLCEKLDINQKRKPSYPFAPDGRTFVFVPKESKLTLANLCQPLFKKIKTMFNPSLSKREIIALSILNGEIAADWQFALNGNDQVPLTDQWDQFAVERAFNLADRFISESQK